MKISKIGTTTITNVLVEDVTIGQIKLNAEVQICIYDDSMEPDFELLNWGDITYMGMKVDNVSELFKFHNTLGINLQSEILIAVDELFTDEVLRDLAKGTFKAVTYN